MKTHGKQVLKAETFFFGFFLPYNQQKITKKQSSLFMVCDTKLPSLFLVLLTYIKYNEIRHYRACPRGVL